MSRDERFPPAPRYRPSSVGWPFVILLLLAGFAIWRFSGSGSVALHDPTAAPRPVVPRGDLADDEQATIEIFQQVSPSVVHITAIGVVRSLRTLDPQYVPQGTGSGFVWSDQGYIVTNLHVIRKAQAAVVTLADGTELSAELAGVAPDQDLAVLKVQVSAEKLRPITVGTSKDLQVGQKVFVIGNPFGFDHTLTTGTIGGLGRSMRTDSQGLIRDVIQTDAAINPGNSGGPLLDSAGRLIGVTTAIYSPTRVSVGIGFAVPVDTVNRVVPLLIKFGKIERPVLGTAYPDHVVRRFFRVEGVLMQPDSESGTTTESGIRPTYRDPVSARIVVGDLVVAIEGQPVKKGMDMYDILSLHNVGDVVVVTVNRGGKIVELKVTLRGGA